MTEPATPTLNPDDSPAEIELDMGIDPFERNWMRVSILLLVVFFVTVSISGFALGFQVSGAETEVDPRTVMDSPPWSEPGLREISEGRYEAYVIAQTWSFAPATIEIPVGSTVTIYVTTPDLQHGFKITDTNVNMQIVPGQVSKLEYTFDEVGDYPYICTEYCGQGHATMFGTISVVPDVAARTDAADESPADDTGDDAG